MMEASESLQPIRDFYSAIARPYDLFAGSVIFDGLRRRAVDELLGSPEDRVLEIGCGTGGNIPALAGSLGADGEYVGLDAAPGMLRRAKRRTAPFDVTLIQGDAADPPLDPGFDAILVTFVSGVLPEPAGAVSTWLDLLRPGGRLVLLDVAGRPGVSTPLDWGFRTFVHLAAPPGTIYRHGRAAHQVLLDRVETAHETVEREASVLHQSTHWRGFVRLTAARA